MRAVRTAFPVWTSLGARAACGLLLGAAARAATCTDYRSYIHLETRVVTAGSAGGVATAGTWAYVADGASGLAVFDVSDPSAPVLVGAVDTPGSATDVAVAANLAYVADGSGGLRVVDVSNPTAPQLLGSAALPSPARTVDLRGTYAFVTVSGPLQIVDVSDPASPAVVATIPDNTAQVALEGNYAYVAASFGPLRIYDITAAASPVLAGTLPGPLSLDVIVRDGRAYLLSWNAGISIVDVSDPAAPVVLASEPPDGGSIMAGLALVGTHLLQPRPDTPLGITWRVLDVSNPALPAVVGLVHAGTSSQAAGTAAIGGRLLVGSEDLDVVDIEVPASAPAAGVDTPGTARDVAVQWPHAYVADGGSLRVLDLSNPSAPIEITSLAVPAQTVAVEGNLLFAGGTSSRHVVDITDPAAPVPVGSLAGGAVDVDVQGRYAYSAGTSSQPMEVVDLADPAAPVVVGSVAAAFGVAVDGAYAYAGPPSTQGLQVIDVSSPTAPTVVGSTAGQSAYLVQKSGEYVYTAYASHGVVSVYDVTDPFAPRSAGTLLVGSVRACGAAPVPGYLYVLIGATGRQELLVLDVSQEPLPSYGAPRVVGAVPLPAAADIGYTGIAVDHGLVVVAAGTAGIFVLGEQCPFPTDVPGETTARSFELRRVWPNPTAGAASVAFALPEAGRVRFEVFDVAGRRVRDVLQGSFPAGRHVVRWDGLGASGARVASGVYVLRLGTGARWRDRRVTILR